MKNTKTNLIVGGIVATMSIMAPSVNANARNNDIENLQKEINILKQRIFRKECRKRHQAL